MIAAAFAVMVAVFKGRPVGDGVIFCHRYFIPVGADGRRARKHRFFHFGFGGRERFNFHRAKGRSRSARGRPSWIGDRIKIVSRLLCRVGGAIELAFLAFSRRSLPHVALAYFATISDYIPIDQAEHADLVHAVLWIQGSVSWY